MVLSTPSRVHIVAVSSGSTDRQVNAILSLQGIGLELTISPMPLAHPRYWLVFRTCQQRQRWYIAIAIMFVAARFIIYHKPRS